jgi:predicted transposase/invertase (TIGR01784 family)
MMSFLNSILPLKENQRIVSLTYEDPAMIPELPELKHSIVDVRCTDNFDRQFIVEMQMYWTNSFKSRMLFNSGKAYIKQIEKGHKYSELKPVYGLSLIDDIFLSEEKYKNDYYHHYRLAHSEHENEIIEGIELIFIELPKFKAQNIRDKKLSVLWLRFLTEIDENTEIVPAELLKESEIKEALEYLNTSAFTKEELAYYDKYWDNVRIEKAALQDALNLLEKERKAKELAQKEKELAQQNEKKAQQEKKLAQQKEAQAKQKLALKMLKYNEPMEEIMHETGLSVNEIEKLKQG